MPTGYSYIRPLLLQFVALLFAAVAFVVPVRAENNDAGTLPQDVEKAVAAMLAAVPKGASVPSADVYAPMLDFALRSAAETSNASPAKRPEGFGAYKRDTVKAPLSRILRYCYDPDIPAEAVYPSAVRRGFWLPGSDLLQKREPLWSSLDHLDAPIVLRGKEFEEITPDTSSGCYYAYKLDRLLILTRYQGRAVFISVSRQQEPSTVGRKGAILGDDGNWEYIYSPVSGSTMSGLGWVDTYMYDSASVAVFFEEAPGAHATGYALFKWVNAGWNNMNVVKPKHIQAGTTRFLAGFKQVLESGKLPPAEDLAALGRELRRKADPDLRKGLDGYCDRLVVVGEKDNLLSSKDFWSVIKDSGYAQSLSHDELVSVYVKNFVKRKIGKPVLDG